jgi:hypothetical protein
MEEYLACTITTLYANHQNQGIKVKFFEKFHKERTS